MINNQIKV